jgi:hypothetical protein
MKRTPLIAALCGGVIYLAAPVQGAPKIQFERTTYDFGATSQVASVTGVFKFKNVGDATLKVEPPHPSCGCTVADLKPDTLQPGETGELAFTFHLGQVKAHLEKNIAVTSNDPEAPVVTLIIKADYTPLFELVPMVVTPNLTFGLDEAEQAVTLTRSDGKPLRIARLDASKPWITAKVEPNDKTNDVTARIRVTIHREGPPRRFNEFVHIYTVDDTNTPVSSLGIYGQVTGEISISPEAVYWSVPDRGKQTSERAEAQVLQRLTIRSAAGRAINLKNPLSSIKGINVELISKEAGKVYELVARLDQVPTNTVSGHVSFETSVAAQSRIEVPVIVNVFNP